jgi:hypothetical protein
MEVYDVAASIERRSVQENSKRWRDLCALADVEQDRRKLLLLIKEINELLKIKEARLRRQKGRPNKTKPKAERH